MGSGNSFRRCAGSRGLPCGLPRADSASANAEPFTRARRAGAFIASITTSVCRAGSCEELTIDVRRASRALRFQLSRRRFHCRRNWPACARNTGCPPWLCSIATAFTARPVFIWPPEKLSLRAHIGAEVTSAAGWRYPLLVESRAGYQNLCRLITRMKLRARKGEGHVSPEEIAEGRRRPDLPHGRRGRPAGARSGARRNAQQGWNACSSSANYSAAQNVYVELQRHFSRAEEARNQAALEIARKLSLPLLATNGVCHARPQQREVLDVFTCIRHHRTLATAGRLLSAQCRAPFEIPRGDGATIFGSSRSHRQHGDSFLALAIHFEGSGVPVSEISRAGGRIANAFSARAHPRRHALALRVCRRHRAMSRARKQIERELAIDRETRSARLLPDRLGHRAILPRAQHPGARARLGRQQRRLLRPGHYRRRSRGHGAALRAISFRRARRMAGYRSRSSQRGPARARHSIRLRALREIGRGHDGQRHHLSRTLGGARNRQGAVVRSRNAQSPGQAGGGLGIQGSRTTRSTANSAMRASTSGIRSSASFSSCACRCRICRATWGSTPAEWWSARDNSIRWCRSSRPRCPGAWWCSGIRKIAPTWAS